MQLPSVHPYVSVLGFCCMPVYACVCFCVLMCCVCMSAWVHVYMRMCVCCTYVFVYGLTRRQLQPHLNREPLSSRPIVLQVCDKSSAIQVYEISFAWIEWTTKRLSDLCPFVSSCGLLPSVFSQLDSLLFVVGSCLGSLFIKTFLSSIACEDAMDTCTLPTSLSTGPPNQHPPTT